MRIIRNEKEWDNLTDEFSCDYGLIWGGKPDYYPCMVKTVSDSGSIEFVFFHPLEARELLRITEEMARERNS